MRLLRPWHAAALVLLVVLGRAPAAHAEDAEALIGRGISLREQGKDDEALALFREAYAKSPTPRGRAQIALAEQALGMWTVAEADLLAALASGTDPWISKNRGALDGALSVVRKHVGSLEVRGADSADVYLDGARIGSGGGPYRVEAGTRRVEIRAKGFHPTARAVEIPAGGIARETITLVAEDAPASPAAEHPRDRVPATETIATGDRGAGQRLLGWGFVGGGAVLAVTGGVGLFVRKGIVDDYNEQCPGLGAAQSPDCSDKVSSAKTWLTISIVTLIAGGISAVAGGVLVGTAPSAKTSARVSCAPGELARGGALFCAGVF